MEKLKKIYISRRLDGDMKRLIQLVTGVKKAGYDPLPSGYISATMEGKREREIDFFYLDQIEKSDIVAVYGKPDAACIEEIAYARAFGIKTVMIEEKEKK